MKDYIIYSDGSTIRLGKVKARNRESAENKGRKLYKINVWCRESLTIKNSLCRFRGNKPNNSNEMLFTLKKNEKIDLNQ